MREILFRIYDKVSERMIYSCDCDEELQGKREFMPFMFPIGFSNYNTNDFSEMMQFTGLTDKSGKKIFDGDIIRFRGFSADPFNALGCAISTGKVIWYEKRFGFYINGLCETWGCDLNRANNIEVIGNVFDNPELLDEVEL